MDAQNQGEQMELVSMGELVERDVAEILGRYELVTAEGKPDREAVADRLEEPIKGALVTVPGDRTKMVAWANDLTERLFHDVPGRALWVEQEDPERAELVWKKLRGEVVRALDTGPNGEMQRRLAENGGLVLCDVRSTRGAGDRGYYVTRNPKCITEDLGNPARQKALSANNKYAALTEMAMERVPEHAAKFDRDFRAGQKLITDGPALTVRGALEVATAAIDDAGDDDVIGDDDVARGPVLASAIGQPRQHADE